MSSPDRSFWRLWWIALAVKTVIAIALPLSNDEAYYWVWGHNVRLSYFDHPPAVAWLFWFGRLFEGLGNGARLPGVWLGHATLLVWFRILKPYLSDKQAWFWLLFVVASPFLGVGSLIITPDVPLLFFWSLSLLILLQLLERPKASFYAAFGAALGLGFCSKYMIVLFVPTALLWLGFSGQWRKVRWLFVPLTILSGLLFCAPVLIWNAQNEWASFAFQLNHGLHAELFSPKWPLDYLGGQLAILFPTTVFFALRQGTPSFLSFFGWAPLAFFFYTSFKARVEANWPEMGHPALLSLAVLGAQPSKRAQKWLLGTASLWALALVLILSQVFIPWLPVDSKKLKTSEFARFDVVAQAIEDLDAPVYLASYQMAGAVSYKLRRTIPKLQGINRRDFFDFMLEARPTVDRFFVVLPTNYFLDRTLPEWLTANTDHPPDVRSLRPVDGEFSIYEVIRRAQDTHR